MTVAVGIRSLPRRKGGTWGVWKPHRGSCFAVLFLLQGKYIPICEICWCYRWTLILTNHMCVSFTYVLVIYIHLQVWYRDLKTRTVDPYWYWKTLQISWMLSPLAVHFHLVYHNVADVSLNVSPWNHEQCVALHTRSNSFTKLAHLGVLARNHFYHKPPKNSPSRLKRCDNCDLLDLTTNDSQIFLPHKVVCTAWQPTRPAQYMQNDENRCGSRYRWIWLDWMNGMKPKAGLIAHLLGAMVILNHGTLQNLGVWFVGCFKFI